MCKRALESFWTRLNNNPHCLQSSYTWWSTESSHGRMCFRTVAFGFRPSSWVRSVATLVILHMVHRTQHLSSTKLTLSSLSSVTVWLIWKDLMRTLKTAIRFGRPGFSVLTVKRGHWSSLSSVGPALYLPFQISSLLWSICVWTRPLARLFWIRR